METIELEAYKAELARKILLTNSKQLLDKVRSLLRGDSTVTETSHVLSEKDEAVSHIKRSMQELKLHKEGKLNFIPLEDVLNEL